MYHKIATTETTVCHLTNDAPFLPELPLVGSITTANKNLRGGSQRRDRRNGSRRFDPREDTETPFDRGHESVFDTLDANRGRVYAYACTLVTPRRQSACLVAAVGVRWACSEGDDAAGEKAGCVRGRREGEGQSADCTLGKSGGASKSD